MGNPAIAEPVVELYEESCSTHPDGERRPYLVRGVLIPGVTYCGTCHDTWCATELPGIVAVIKLGARLSMGC